MIDILTTLPTDAFVTAAFAELIDDVTGLLAAADGTDERAFWRRQQTALNKAQYHFLNGVRPTLTGDAYLMPSSESRGLHVYRLIKRGGVVECDCKAGQNGILCHHHMAINVYERAAELESLSEERGARSDDGPERATHRSSLIAHRSEAAQWVAGQQLLTLRLTATAQYVAALRSAQQRPATQHISAQARNAYARANQPAARRPLFADRDAESFRRQALAEERAILLEQRARRCDPPGPNIEDDSPGDEPPVYPAPNGRTPWCARASAVRSAYL